MRAAFALLRNIRQDAVDNEASMKTRLTMPVLAVGGEKSFGNNEAIVMRNAADKVTEVVVPGAGHWLMEEAPAQTIRAIRDFIAP
nr:alpha/beta hydrolase [Pseudomonas sp. TH31]